jgi:hypothetical protein
MSRQDRQFWRHEKARPDGCAITLLFAAAGLISVTRIFTEVVT